MDAKELESDLNQFTGTEGYHRWSILFRSMVLTDGAKYLAEKAGAYWLMDAIASHQPAMRKNAKLQDFQLWILKRVKGKEFLLACYEDSDRKPFIKQKIEYSDFPLDEIKFYVQPADESTKVVMLTSEY